MGALGHTTWRGPELLGLGLARGCSVRPGIAGEGAGGSDLGEGPGGPVNAPGQGEAMECPGVAPEDTGMHPG